MGDAAIHGLQEKLHRRIGDFLNRGPRGCRDLRPFIERFSKAESNAFFFGGFLRDLMVRGPSVIPRDIDIVVREFTPALQDIIDSKIKRRNRFGGVNLDSEGWAVDLWTLESTWAFREGIVSGGGFPDLPKTTFLNIQAVTAEVAPPPGRPRTIYSHGFFEAILGRTLDINCEDNPYPHLCVMQSLLSAAQLRFFMSPRLARYVLHYGNVDGLEPLIDVQMEHYGCVHADLPLLHGWFEGIAEQLAAAAQAHVGLPNLEHLTACPRGVLPARARTSAGPGRRRGRSGPR